jgi:hypothetical protein
LTFFLLLLSSSFYIVYLLLLLSAGCNIWAWAAVCCLPINKFNFVTTVFLFLYSLYVRGKNKRINSKENEL